MNKEGAVASEIKKLERRKKARKKLNELSSKEEHVLVIHYSCESFYDRPEGQTPRVTSIAVRNYESGQTTSFSMHKIAELNIQKNYDMLEKEMLHEFYDFMKHNSSHYWVHWNMRDINYGFSALEHRFKILGGEPFFLDDSKKVDLSRSLIALYTNGYAPHPRIIKLMEMNRITAKDLLDGQGEADAFENKDFVKLHQSTLRKVDVFCNFLGRTLDGSLITKATWWELNGGSVKAVGEVISNNWMFTLVAGVVGIAAGVYTFI